LGARFLAIAFGSDGWFLRIARHIEPDLMWDTPSRASFGKGQHQKLLRVPIGRHVSPGVIPGRWQVGFADLPASPESITPGGYGGCAAWQLQDFVVMESGLRSLSLCSDGA
jgi:hypothetical protein